MSTTSEGASRFQTSQLLYPECLSTEDLKTILKDRCIQLKRLESKTREELLALVHRVAVPLPQRNNPNDTPEISPLLLAAGRSNQSEAVKLDNCINYKRKVIKLKKSSDCHSTCRKLPPQEQSQSITNKVARISLKRSESTTTESKSSDDSSTVDESNTPAKKARTKITWP